MQRLTERMRRCTGRLPHYDYTRAGAYFITICTWRRACLFGEVVDRRVRLSPEGEVVHDEWLRTGLIRPGVELDSFVVMPNYIEENPRRWVQTAEAALELCEGAPPCAPTKPYTGGSIP